MEFPKTASELAIWLGMQFPVLGTAVLSAWFAVKYTGQLHKARIEDAKTASAELLVERERRIRERDERIRQLKAEVAELRAKLYFARSGLRHCCRRTGLPACRTRLTPTGREACPTTSERLGTTSHSTPRRAYRVPSSHPLIRNPLLGKRHDHSESRHILSSRIPSHRGSAILPWVIVWYAFGVQTKTPHALATGP